MVPFLEDVHGVFLDLSEVTIVSPEEVIHVDELWQQWSDDPAVLGWIDQPHQLSPGPPTRVQQQVQLSAVNLAQRSRQPRRHLFWPDRHSL